MLISLHHAEDIAKNLAAQTLFDPTHKFLSQGPTHLEGKGSQIFACKSINYAHKLAQLKALTWKVGAKTVNISLGEKVVTGVPFWVFVPENLA